MFFRVFRSRSLQNRSGACLNVSGMFLHRVRIEFASAQSIRSEHSGILQFWEFFCQRFREKNRTKNTHKQNRKAQIVIEFFNTQVTGRIIKYYDNTIIGVVILFKIFLLIIILNEKFKKYIR